MKPIKLIDGDHLNAIIAQGVNLPIVQDKDGKYCVFSKHKDRDANYSRSSWYKDKEEAKQRIGAYWGYSKEELDEDIKEENWQIVDWVVQETEPMEKCIVMDNVEEEHKKNNLGWDNKMKEIIGKELEVMEDCGSYCLVYNEGKSNWWFLPKTCLIPVIEGKEEDDFDEEEAIRKLKKRGRIKSGDIIK